MAFVLGIAGSPRKGGNSERLLQAFMEGLLTEGIRGEILKVNELKIGPCQGCRFCEREGYCKLEDGIEEVFELLRRSDVIVLSSPVFFYGFPAQTKVLIDRSQVLWARKYRLGLSDPKERWRKGILLAIGATKGQNLFYGLELSFRYFMDSIGGKLEKVLSFREIEKPGDIERHETALSLAFSLGKEIALALNSKNKVIFVCHENARRSQMAEAFLQYYAGEKIDAESAGDSPSREIDRTIVTVMAEKGIDLLFRRPKGLDRIDLGGNYDWVVTMGCEIFCPQVKGKHHEEWEIEDPKGKNLEEVRLIRDRIEERVKKLKEKIDQSIHGFSEGEQ